MSRTQDAPWAEPLEAVLREWAKTAAARDKAGGTAFHERRLLRESGLLRLSLPVEYGGDGAPWSTTLDVVRRMARVDSSLAHLFAFHHLQLATIRLFGSDAQIRHWSRETVAQGWFWGNALNPLDKSTRALPGDAGGYVFDGRKSFCSGARDSDQLLASAFDGDGRLLIGITPTNRAGITVLDDWDNMGQRQTDSGTVIFERVPIAADELLLNPGPLSSPFATLRPLLAQSILCHIYLGIGEGALQAARDATLAQTRPWIASQAERPAEDPYVIAHYGDFFVALEGACLLVERSMQAFDCAWARGLSLTESERGEVAVAVATAKVAAARAGLDVAHRMFEVTGARSTTAALRLDRFWRNVRVHTLHDPLDYKVRELGDWALNGRIPKPSFYS
ncbi:MULTISPECIES: acyl-CoA dehydrogenase family protein [Caballeronia]|uniref:Dibenzothiophene monooxygenase n=1 Tax=Caballeronia zhejiangensis TaxID=871203 RepID=A0A656QSY9_9BURK|nr:MULTISPECIES: acyl-CoA dehydrogenase family protein [Caballeronia]EKS71323.1 Acyl-CoA dehydrogenase [Burkholderia sp. SJ98]KDR32059.1 monooxygenase [Caballeronia zhejiangensis]MDR5790331.1 acyl-CoA dehydrogenase family protein [Caballeronia sp. LP003]